MVNSSKKMKPADDPTACNVRGGGLDLTRAGVPAPDSVVEVRRMERGGRTCRIIQTDERDGYDEPEAKRRKE